MRALAASVRLAVALAAGALVAGTQARAAAPSSTEGANGPTIVLVHGAWEQASSWRLVAEQLRARGYPGRRAGDRAADARRDAPRRSPTSLRASTARPCSSDIRTVAPAISNVAASPNVVALVFIAAFAPDRGESILRLDARDLGSLVATSLVPVPFVTPTIGVDLFIELWPPYRSVFAADVAEPAATEMAATQLPPTLAALSEPSAEPAWKTIASWYLVAANDLAIPPATERFMAGRAKRPPSRSPRRMRPPSPIPTPSWTRSSRPRAMRPRRRRPSPRRRCRASRSCA